MSIEQQPSQERMPSVESMVFNPQETSWDEVREAILHLEEVCFNDGGFSEDDLREIFEDPKNAVVMLRVNDELVGFTCGVPDENDEESFYIETTEIHPDWQGNKFITSMITALEYEAKRRGYMYLTRHAAVPNGYADKVGRNYEGRVVESKPHQSEQFGEQQYFKIRL